MKIRQAVIESFFVLAVFFAVGDRALHLAHTIQISKPHTNQLCLGECYAKKNAPQKIFTEWELPTDFDHSTRKNIYDLRNRRIAEREYLFTDGYIPTRSIFGLIVDGLPWWGFDGFYRSATRPSAGLNRASGKSLRGVEILNPFYLVTAKITNFSIWNRRFNWKGSGSAEGGACMYFPKTEGVVWSPAQGRAEATYYVSEWIETLNKNNCIEPISDRHLEMELDPVNAQDLGLNYLAFSPEESVNISEEAFFPRPRRLNFFYHRGTSCGLPSGCNNISPLVKEFHEVKTTGRTGTLAIKLWQNEPESSAAKPDMTYLLKFE